MTPDEPQAPQTVDITRWSRKDRRNFKGLPKDFKIYGRNLPYQKAIHGSLQQYYEKRNEEIAKENQPHANDSTKQAV